MHLFSMVTAFCKSCKKQTKHDKGFEKLDGKYYIVCIVCHAATEVPPPENRVKA